MVQLNPTKFQGDLIILIKGWAKSQLLNQNLKSAQSNKKLKKLKKLINYYRYSIKLC